MLEQNDFYEHSNYVSTLYCEGEYHVSMELRNEEERTKYFLALLQKYDCVIQRYYWRSLYDETHIEYLEPKIYDAFYMVIDAYSHNKENLLNVMEEYNKNKVRIGYLGRCNRKKLTEEGIKEYANKYLQLKYRRTK